MAYYGVKFWNEREVAEEQMLQVLQSEKILDTKEWSIIELEEGEMKLCNVKLKNDPELLVFWGEARKPTIQRLGN
ncbi:hypothetical protein [Paenibacillus sp. SYP-B3998]|uniref:hypothetical protein n=1 Tax=Paenibacillus sp. SYP-B3998 TaxID=2678564 RepID=UPI0019683678|nr:hypothetical protein [Paenibacillus sp. SYP-B3998]